MAKKPTQIKRALKPDEFVKHRGRKGYRKFRSDILLVAEVWSKKTGKRVGFLNAVDKKTKKPMPRRFSSMQRALNERKKGERPPSQFDSMKFRVSTSRLIKDQIPNRVVDKINDQISIDGECVIAVEISLKAKRAPGDIFHVGSGIFLDRKMTRGQLAMMITLEIVQGAHTKQIRTSPKKYSTSDKNKKRKMPRFIYVEVKFLRLK